ncbi:class I SAM-dependent methyltransferase [Legionella sp. km772]|uniref:class I SAM-dependent methyltransferase n=1 Tax=Legionella sp. km772 TaxID=2498111 RepID=UPI000F8D18DD|nr:class I SAM-dependent methyltransferase [Legionella sp. km772]RUR14226.1 class I SAM-dependent methyltransferase [Legionella sp. km772]
MKTLKHTTAKASYYNTRAECYDEFNENNSKAINALLEKILKENQVATVFDLTCGTGSQVFWLVEAGFEIVGSDISRSMLKIAKQKAKLKQLKIKFLQGDCRTVHAGQFDAAITIFNAIGHLTREDFKLTIQNINSNLHPGGLYIFDIFNLDYLKAGNNITKLTGDWMAATDGQKFREIQFSTISDDGILASYSTYVYQDGNESPTKVSKGYENTLQVYSSAELQNILKENGFVILAQTDINGEAFSKEASERILTVAKKV